MSDDAVSDASSHEPDWSPFHESQIASPKGWIDFVNLEGGKESFYAPDAGKPYGGTRVPDCDAVVPWDGDDELLYPISDNRYVLVYWDDSSLGGSPKPWINRELLPEEASLWFMLNRMKPPPPLKPVPIRDPSEDPESRLNREWQPTKALAELPDLVTLDQAAAAVHMSKRTLERHKTEGTLPDPVREGGGGKPALYDWKIMRLWLTKTFGINLPEKFPANLR
jgi:hypothetical protein